MRRLGLTVVGALIFLTALSSLVWAAEKCGGADIANGPLTYTPLGVSQATFTGSDGSPVTTSFNVTAPSVDPKQQTDAPDVFPGQGNNDPCSGIAAATIAPVEVQQVGDTNGQPIDPVDIDLSSGLGLAIAGAFVLTPGSYTFGIGETVSVTVVVTDPHVTDAEYYGDYDVKLAAKAPGYGIGVGNGPHFLLRLRGVTATDTTPPVVTVTKPSGDEFLGVIAVEVQAYDPISPLPATGLASLSATVSSAGGAVSNAPIPLTLLPTLPVVAGVTVTGTGSFTPRGGAPGAGPGTSDTEAFTNAAPSGIGTYTISAQAKDGAGNIGYDSKTFKVNYAVTFTKADSTNPCQSGGNANCMGQFQFTVNRSNITSDGAFMFDHTVAVVLVRTGDNVVLATHYYGTGDIKSVVQIDSTGPTYKTNFKRGDIGASGPVAYTANVYVLDVDGNYALQATSIPVTF